MKKIYLVLIPIAILSIVLTLFFLIKKDKKVDTSTVSQTTADLYQPAPELSNDVRELSPEANLQEEVDSLHQRGSELEGQGKFQEAKAVYELVLDKKYENILTVNEESSYHALAEDGLHRMECGGKKEKGKPARSAETTVQDLLTHLKNKDDSKLYELFHPCRTLYTGNFSGHGEPISISEGIKLLQAWVKPAHNTFTTFSKDGYAGNYRIINDTETFDDDVILEVTSTTQAPETFWVEFVLRKDSSK